MTDGYANKGTYRSREDITREVKKMNKHNIPIHGLAYGHHSGMLLELRRELHILDTFT